MLNYSIIVFERAIAFQITAQSEDYAQFLDFMGGTFKASNGWIITADITPALDPTRKLIYLRGDDETKNLRVDRTYDMDSNHEAWATKLQAEEAIEEFRVHAELYSEVFGATLSAISVASKTTGAPAEMKGTNTDDKLIVS